MKRAVRSRQGYAFLAALGVMVIAFLVVFAMSSSTQFSYHVTDQTHGGIQGRQMAESAAEYTLALMARDQLTTGTQPFQFTANHLRGTEIAGTLSAEKLAADHRVYQSPALAHRPGDVLVEIRSEQLNERYGPPNDRRVLLCNLSGRRVRPIDVTVLLQSALAK